MPAEILHESLDTEHSSAGMGCNSDAFHQWISSVVAKPKLQFGAVILLIAMGTERINSVSLDE